MICERCQQEGKRSTVQGGAGITTLMGYSAYWDQDGDYHCHNPNITTTSYHCSNGHHWTVKSNSECPNSECNYGKDE